MRSLQHPSTEHAELEEAPLRTHEENSCDDPVAGADVRLRSGSKWRRGFSVGTALSGGFRDLQRNHHTGAIVGCTGSRRPAVEVAADDHHLMPEGGIGAGNFPEDVRALFPAAGDFGVDVQFDDTRSGRPTAYDECSNDPNDSCGRIEEPPTPFGSLET